MLLKLLKFLSSLKSCFKKNKSDFNIPTHIDESEKIVRSVFSPINLHKTKGILLSNTFRTPPGIDEVSVNRLDYTTPDFCKSESKKNENPSANRSYFGLALLYKSEISNLKCEVLYTPIISPKDKINPYHADIKVGYIPKKGEQLPSEIAFKVNSLTSTARFYKDPSPELENWMGGALA